MRYDPRSLSILFTCERTGRLQPPWKRVGLMAKALRADAELSCSDVADEMRCDRVHVSRFENGRHRASVRWAARYAEALGLEPQVLLVVLDDRWCTQALMAERRVGGANARRVAGAPRARRRGAAGG